MFVELHMIQNMAPSDLNRDDANNPKDCEFGGVRRARISSQCLKRAIRRSPVFAQATVADIGTRTKYVLRQLRERLLAAGKTEEKANAVLQAFVPQLLSKVDKDGKRTAVLLYLSNDELAGMTRQLLDHWGKLVSEKTRDATIGPLVKTLVKEFKDRTSAPDIALFGRMLAEKPELGLEAACQVAHAISTHRVTMEMDFYTAVDDLNPEDTAGAGMMGFTGFDSACFYRYARIDWEQLVKNLDGDIALARRTVEAFLRASVAALPTGKQNTFAAHNPPSFLLAVVRQDGMGWSLANAFERPVYAQRDAGLVAPSVAAMDAYWGRLCRVYGTAAITRTAALALDPELPIEALQGTQVENLEAWVGAVLGALPE
jgi:CRISPR system Cascade subunit CasC